MKNSIFKLLEEYYFGLKVGKDFLNKTQKSMDCKKKTDKSEPIKIKTYIQQEHTNKFKFKPQTKRFTKHTTNKRLHPDFVKNYHKSKRAK